MIACLLLALAADDWPHWRGPARNGISAETGIIDRWPEGGPKVAWTAEVGIGFSSLVVGGGRALTMGFADEKDTLYCFDAAKGALLWKHSWPSELGDKYFDGGTCGSPTFHGDDVYALSRWGDLMRLEAATGKVRWSVNIQKESGAPIPDWGYSGSPFVHGDRLILNIGESGVAVDRATGKIAWKSAARECGYSTPLPFKSGKDERLLMSSTTAYIAIDPATGREAWRIPWDTEYGVNSADPIVEGDRVFLSSGYNYGAGLFKIAAGGAEQVWKSKVMRNHMNPCVLIDGHLYGPDGNTGRRPSLKCIALATGEEKWSAPEAGVGPVAAVKGTLIVLSETGELMVAPASPEGFKPAARARILTGRCWTVPVLASGRIYARNAAGRVVCVEVSTR